MKRNIEFSVPYNGDIDIIEHLPSSVVEMYGRLSNDGFYGGRASYSISDVEKETFPNIISKCNEKSIRFNYLLNSPYQSPNQFSDAFKNDLSHLLRYLCDVGVWGITVSLPNIALYSKKHFPELAVTVSKFARVNTISRLKIWENIGVDRICLDGNLTKRPKLIKLIAKNSKIPLVMLCNDACLEDCPFENFHAMYEGVHSANDDSTYVSYFSTLCKQIMAQDKSSILKTTFIRPEDLQTYSEWGISTFKLVDRNRPTWWISIVIDAYNKGYYNGNLADILSLYSPTQKNNEKNIDVESNYSLHKIQSLKKDGVFDLPVFIDNKKLNGYILEIEKNDCDFRDKCSECKFCDTIAENAITFTEGRSKFFDKSNILINRITS